MKERKILTKLGIIFGIIDLLLILFGVIFLKPKNVIAEELQNDFLINNEIYLFSDINSINFENGYIDKELITIDNKNNNENWFGWYSNLGYNLVERNFDDTNQYYCLAIPLNNMLSKYLQFAFRFSRGPDLALIIKYSDNTTTEFATSDYTETKQIYTPIAENINKNVTYIAWEIYNPDYYISFLPLTQEAYYELGFEEGKSTGFDEGIQTGYNVGYQEGYQSAIESGEVVYTRIQTFNQLVRNGNFVNASGWDHVTISEPNTATYNFPQAYTSIQRTNKDVDIQLSHKYYCHITYKGDSETTRSRWYFTLGNINNADFVQYQLPNVTEEYQNARFIIQYKSSIVGSLENIKNLYLYNTTNYAGNLYVRNIYIIDLTTMFGAGFEPTIEECNTIFYNDYYEYNTGTPLEIGYYTGYYDGKNDGLQEGINIGETNQINMGWIQEIFRAIQTFFNIQIFPRVTLGIIVGIPFIITLAWFVIRMFRGGGGGED